MRPVTRLGGLPGARNADAAVAENSLVTLTNNREPSATENVLPQRVIGDLNSDGVVTSIDALIVINHLASNRGNAQAVDDMMADYSELDANNDGVVSSLDARMVINQLIRSRSSD